jgi:hypothetical protein
MNKDGVIPKENWTHRWMVPFLTVMPWVEKNASTFLHGNPVHIEIPLRIFDWESFIVKAKSFFKTNFMPFLMLLCGGIGQFHYKKIIECIGMY